MHGYSLNPVQSQKYGCSPKEPEETRSAMAGFFCEFALVFCLSRCDCPPCAGFFRSGGCPMQGVFDRAMDHVLAFEGGYVNDPQDPGGETIYGISRRHHPEAWQDGRPTQDQAKAIYLRDYWQGCRCSDLPAAVAVLVFDGAINQGQSRAVKCLQEALGVTVDGLIGPKTIAAANNCDAGKLARCVVVERAYHYGQLNKIFGRFGRGWMRRLIACYDLAISLI